MQPIAVIVPWADRLISIWIALLSVFLVCTGLMWFPERGLFPDVAQPTVLTAILLCAFRPKQAMDWFREPIGMAHASVAGYFALT